MNVAVACSDEKSALVDNGANMNVADACSDEKSVVLGTNAIDPVAGASFSALVDNGANKNENFSFVDNGANMNDELSFFASRFFPFDIEHGMSEQRKIAVEEGAAANEFLTCADVLANVDNGTNMNVAAACLVEKSALADNGTNMNVADACSDEKSALVGNGTNMNDADACSDEKSVVLSTNTFACASLSALVAAACADV
jgi:hypothetical protein